MVFVEHFQCATQRTASHTQVETNKIVCLCIQRLLKMRNCDQQRLVHGFMEHVVLAAGQIVFSFSHARSLASSIVSNHPSPHSWASLSRLIVRNPNVAFV